MPELKSLKALEEHLKKQIDDVLKNEVAKQVKKIEREKIYEVVYGAYGSYADNEPKVYKRDYDNGGLSDPENMEVDVVDGVFKMTNKTGFNPGYNTENYGVGLDELVEYGHGGRGGNYEHPKGRDTWGDFHPPRPFTQETIDELNQSKEHLDQLWAGLRRRGIHVE